MALSRAFTTLGELAELDVPGDREVLDRLIEVVDQVYPDTWREWRVIDYSKKDLFGSRMDPQILNKLRFAIPTISIIKSFDPEATAVSEKKFKSFKLSLLDWPFCRALIMSPKPLATKIHGSASNLEIFTAAISEIGSSFISREEAESLMSGKEKRKRPSSQSSQHRVDKKRKTEAAGEISELKKQTKALQDMVANLLSRQSQESDSYSNYKTLSASEEEFYVQQADKENDGRCSSIFQAPDMAVALPGCSTDLFEFSPCIKEAEPKIMLAPKDLLDQGVSCQKFGMENWANIRYNEVNKKLQATPAFTALSVNPQLAGKTPNWVPYEQVVKYDQTLGAITHGLLQQKKQLIEVLTNVANEIKSKDLNEAILKHITHPDSDFRKFNNDLLQYACGRRAELFEFRRSLYKPPSKFMHAMLHKIPPSSTHLFEENALSETIKQNGGFYKIFPTFKNFADDNTRRLDYKYSSAFQTGRQQIKKKKPQSTASSSSVNRGFRKSYEGKPNNRKRERGGGHNQSPRLHQGGQRPNPIDYFQKNHLAGRLKNFIEVWQSYGAPSYIKSVLKGMSIPFSRKPPLMPRSKKNLIKFRTETSHAMHQEIKKLFQMGAIEECNYKTVFLSRVFLVPKSDGSRRPVLNLKPLNRFMFPKPFRLVNHQKVPNFLQRNDFLAKIDLSNAYLHVPIKPVHRRFLALSFDNQCYQMTALPFGLSVAPIIFARLTNWVASLLRSKGVRVIVYLDDFLLASQDLNCLKGQIKMTVDILTELGWIINWDKSILVPTHKLEFLGIIWDTKNNIKCISVKKIRKTQKALFQIRETRCWTWRKAKSLLGLLVFAAFVVPLGLVNCRLLQRAVNKLNMLQPDRIHVVPEIAFQDVNWWLENVHKRSSIFVKNPTVFLSTDASEWGWGAELNGEMISVPWGTLQRTWHINVKELYAVYETLRTRVETLKGQTIVVQSDNRSVISYIRRQGGTKSARLLKLSKRLLELCLQAKITLRPQYIPGRYNLVADSLSRDKKLAEWSLSPAVTKKIFERWGMPQIDLFASELSAVVPRYVSQDPRDKKAVFTNAFSRKWDFGLAWVFPPPTLIPQVLQHLNSAKGIYVVIAPKWEKSFWRVDLRRRATAPPFQIRNLQHHLVDLTTAAPPLETTKLILEAWRIRGGTI